MDSLAKISRISSRRQIESDQKSSLHRLYRKEQLKKIGFENQKIGTVLDNIKPSIPDVQSLKKDYRKHLKAKAI